MFLHNAARILRERHTSLHVPYLAHVSANVISTRAGDYLQVFRLGGIGFETADDAKLNTWHERLNVMWRNVASPHVALWTHIIRRRERITPGQSAPGFVAALNASYRQRLSGETLMLNELYLTLLYRPVVGVAPSLLARLLAGSGKPATHSAEALDACEKLGRIVGASLQECDPEPLGLYQAGSRVNSRLLEF